jgi:hypothetical protein
MGPAMTRTRAARPLGAVFGGVGCAMGLATATIAQDDGRAAPVGTQVFAAQVPPAPGGGTAWVTGRFKLDGTQNTVAVSAFADEALSQPLFRNASIGTVEIRGRPDVFARAGKVISRNDASTVEVFVDAPELWAGPGLAVCPLVVGVATDISDRVAGGPFHIAACAETDVLRLSADGTQFRTGGRDTDRCIARPPELSVIDDRHVDD